MGLWSDALGFVGDILGFSSSGDAAEAQAEAAKYASDIQWKMYQQSRQDAMPWLNAGQQALNSLMGYYAPSVSAPTTTLQSPVNTNLGTLGQGIQNTAVNAINAVPPSPSRT